MQPFDGRLRRAAGRKEGQPPGRNVIVESRLGACRHIGQRGEPRVAGDRQGPRVPRCDRRHDIGEELKPERNGPGDQVGTVLRDVAVRNVDDLHARDLFEISAREMLRATHPDGAVIELLRAGFGVVHKLRHGFDGQLAAAHDDVRDHGEKPDRLEAFFGVVAEVAEEVPVRRERSRGAHEDRVAVRLDLARSGRPGVAARARPIVDYETASDRGSHALEHDAGDDVARASARERHDHLDGSHRIVLGARATRGEKARQHRGSQKHPGPKSSLGHLDLRQRAFPAVAPSRRRGRLTAFVARAVPSPRERRPEGGMALTVMGRVDARAASTSCDLRSARNGLSRRAKQTLARFPGPWCRYTGSNLG